MSVFSLVGKGVMFLVQNPEVAEFAVKVGKKGISKVGAWMDTDGDGDFDENDVENLIQYILNATSILGHAAIADGVVSDDEEEYAIELIEKMTFDEEEGLIPEDLIGKFNLKKKELRKKIHECFESPVSLKALSEYAKEKDLEQIYYEFACAVVLVDNNLVDEERAFLDKLARLLDISNIDKKKIEKNTAKQFCE